jgi:hypothetical protein
MNGDTPITNATDSIKQLIRNFEDYIMTFNIQQSLDGTRLELDFTLWSYDLIDKDLDMDERKYSDLCAHFRKWLHTVIKEVVGQHMVEVVCRENKAIFRNKMEFLSQTEYKLINNIDRSRYITVKRETREKLLKDFNGLE